MLKYPSPIEQDLDKLRDKMWREADQDPKKWFALIHERTKQGLQELGYSPKQSGFGVVRDKGKAKYKTR